MKTLEQHVAFALDYAQTLNTTAAAVSVTQGEGLGVTVRKSKPEAVEYYQDQSFSVTVYAGQAKGSASSTDLSEASMRKAVKAAADIARFTEEDPCAGLPLAADMATEWPELDVYHPWELSVDEALAIAENCEQAGLTNDPRISNSEGASLSIYQGQRALGNSHGFLHSFASSKHHVSCTLLAEQNGQMERDSSYTVARNPHALWSPEQVGVDAAERTIKRLGACKLPTQKVPVTFAAEEAAGIFSSFLSAINGENLYRQASFLLNDLGNTIFPTWLMMREDPFVSQGLASSPYDAEGVRVQARHLVENGVLQDFILNSYTARQLKLQNTGNAGGPHNISITPSLKGGLSALLAEMDKGLLVTDVMGQGVNLVTGDYSRGASGFWVENGQIQYPVHEITIAGNLRDMYQQIQAVGGDVDQRSSILTGSVLIEAMMVGGE